MRKSLLVIMSLIMAVSLASAAAASPFAPAPDQSLQVTLIGHDGAPLQGALVQLFQPGIPGASGVRTDSRGQASLPLPPGFSFWLRAWAVDHAVLEQPYVPLSDGYVITLRAEAYRASLLGLVTDEKGRAVPGAEISLWAEGRGFQGSVRTGPDGLYAFHGIRADGAYTLQVAATGYQAFAQSNLTLAPGARNQADIALTPAWAIITGELVSARLLNPVQNARVELLQDGWGLVERVFADSFGYFRITAPPTDGATYQLRIWATNYEALLSGGFAAPAGSWTDFSGANRFELNPLFAQLAGSVLGEGGSPLQNSPVELQLSGLGTVETGLTDENGFYTFRQIRAGTYRVRAVPETGEIPDASPWITLSGGQRATADVSANSVDNTAYGRSAIVGTIRDAQDEPLEGAVVQVTRGPYKWEAVTDAQGRYRVNVDANVEDVNEDPETSTGYRVEARLTGYISSDQPDTAGGGLPPSLVDVRARSTTRVDIQLQPAYGDLAGRVLDDRGQPLPGVPVALRIEGAGELSRVNTDELGRYRFAALEVARQARYLPVVTTRSYLEASVAPGGGQVGLSSLNPGSVTMRNLTVRPAATSLTGIVRAGAQQPAALATVTVLRPSDGSTWSGTANEEGLYQIDLPARPGEQYLVRAGLPGAARGTVADPVSFGDSYGLVSNLAVVRSATVTGQVLDANGRPAAGHFVALWAEGESRPLTGVTTDNLGQYRIEGVAAGRRYAVAAQGGGETWSSLSPGEPIFSPLITPTSGETVRVDLLVAAGM